MVPLLQKFFFIRDRVSFDQILKLREVRRAQESPYHSDFFQATTRSKVTNDQNSGRFCVALGSSWPKLTPHQGIGDIHLNMSLCYYMDFCMYLTGVTHSQNYLVLHRSASRCGSSPSA